MAKLGKKPRQFIMRCPVNRCKRRFVRCHGEAFGDHLTAEHAALFAVMSKLDDDPPLDSNHPSVLAQNSTLIGSCTVDNILTCLDVIQAPELWELEDGALRSDGLRMEHYTAFTVEQAARGAAGRRPASVERHFLGTAHGGAVA